MSDAPQGPKAPSFLVGLLRDWGIALVVVLVVLLGYNALFPSGPPSLGPATDFTLDNLEGAEVTLSELDSPSDVIVLNFWFTTCPPCRAEIPELSEFADAHPDIPLYGVSTDLNLRPAQLKAASKRLGIRYPVLHDVRAQVSRRYGVNQFPTTLVIRDMQIVQARVGAVDRKTLEAMVEAAR